jgi:hypothetical protein
MATGLAEAQSFYAIRKERSLIAVGGIGTSTYFGELANEGDYFDAKPTLSAGLQYYFTNRISARAELSWFQLKGDDAKADDNSRKKRNLSFYSNNFELSLIGQFNFFPMGQRFYQRPKLNFYGFAGIGVLYFNPMTEYQGEKYALQPLKTEGVTYKRIQPAIPYGLGVRLMIDPFFNICVEGGYRKLFTDYLDDVSTVHLGPGAFSDPIAQALSDRRPELGLPPVAAGTQRGNPEADDSYYHLMIKVEYYLPHNFLFGSTQKKLYRNKRKAYYRKRR